VIDGSLQEAGVVDRTAMVRHPRNERWFVNAEPLLLWMQGEEGVYSTKRTPEARRLPVPITSFQNVRD